MITLIIFFALLAGVAANLNTNKENVKLCNMYAQILLFSGLVTHTLGLMVAQRDLVYSPTDSLTLFYVAFSGIVPAVLNMYAVSLFVYSKNPIYRLLIIPLSLNIMWSLGVQVENLIYDTIYIWEIQWFVPAMSTIEIVLLLGGSDVVRDKLDRSLRDDDLHSDGALHNKISNHRHQDSLE